MAISKQEQKDIFNIIIIYPGYILWHSIGRDEPSPDAYADAVHFMEKGSSEHEKMKTALLSVFTTAKKIRYYRQLKLLALMFDTDANGVSSLNLLRLSVAVKEGMIQRGLTTISSIEEAFAPLPI